MRTTAITPPAIGGRFTVTQIGLSAHDVLVLESLLRLRQDIGRHCHFDPVPAPGQDAEVVFVDGDDRASREAWQLYRREHPRARAILLLEKPEFDDGDIAVGRPLSFRRLDELQLAITRACPHVAQEADADDGLHVLLVDDSALARAQVRASLAQCAEELDLELHIDEAEAGEPALARAQSQAYDLVLLDVVMPGMDGYETCRRLRALQPVRVAMLTSRRQGTDYDRGHAAGCDHYIAKPAPAEMLARILRITALKKQLPVH